jgi:NitT/TauT family transport system ATP-binding protein
MIFSPDNRSDVKEIEPVLVVKNLEASFPNGNGGLHALKAVSFPVFPQEFICILGPSGSGKSTLLRILAGVLKPSGGSADYPGGTPRIGFVFQQSNLMPWRTVLDNITLPLEVGGMPQQKAYPHARELIDLVGLQGFEKSWPRDLSGGMAQKVAIARALIHDPDILLLDEPFGSLDALTRERMGSELLRIWQIRCKTVVMVTHSISEALFLSDRILVLTQRPGTIKMEMKVEFPRPRSEEIRYTGEFGRMAHQLKDAIE